MNVFDKLLEIQVSFEVLTSMLKDGKKKYIKVEDAVSYVCIITNSTPILDKAEMEAILVKFDEFHKSNEEDKHE